MATSLEAFQTALAHHQAGRLNEAEILYRQILDADPRHADALHLLGLISHQRGDHAAAEHLIGQAIAIDGQRATFHTNLGEVYRALGRLDAAEQALGRAIALDPNSARAQNNLGIVLAALDRSDEAIEAYRRAIARDAGFAEPHNNLGTTLQARGQADEAIDCYRRAIAINPDYAAAHANLGTALAEARQDRQAAADAFREALRHDPRNGVARVNLGKLIEDEGRLDEALKCYEQALAADPNSAVAHVRRANVCHTQGRLREAATDYETALRLAPHNAEAHTNLGLLKSEQGQFDEARAHLDEAARLRPEVALVHHNRAMLLLLAGDFARGWPEYEWRWRLPGAAAPISNTPAWDGGPLEGRTILLYPEQGAGDMLQFIRYAPLVADRGGRVVVGCPERMQDILSTCRGIDRFYTGSAPPPFDTHAALVSLPGIFGTTLESIPADVPYLAAEPARVERWRAVLGNNGRLRIGINWQGSPTYALDERRSMALAEFAPLAEVEGVQLVSLQHGAGTEQLADAPFAVETLGDEVDREAAFVDTAAVIENLDLVITSDTAVAHLAGALGAPVWLAVGYSPDWRWLIGRDDSPWYPTMRLFRQSRPGDWSGVFERMARQLEARAARARSGA